MLENPYTVFTVASVLGFALTPDQWERAELLAYKLFKHVHADNEPVSCEMNCYSDDDAWILRISVKKVFEGVDCAGRYEEMVSNDVWKKICGEIDK